MYAFLTFCGNEGYYLLFLKKSKQKSVTFQVCFDVTTHASQYVRLHIGTLSEK